MPDILDRILAVKREEVAAARRAVPLEAMRERAHAAAPARDFIGSIRARHAGGAPAVIAEIKRSSPSKGVFRSDFDPARFAADYERNGAACLSVLTDRQFFGGNLEDLASARAACTLPVLRKDFMIDAYQVLEARAAGADCILLISGAIDVAVMCELEGLAHFLGMAVLVESHNAAELSNALRLSTPLMGINNRDLKTFATDLSVTETLRPMIPEGRIVVAESGISEPAHIARLTNYGVSTYLVGGALMDSDSPGAALSKLLKG